MRNREGPLNAPYTCNVICPCWLGGDTDGGECKGILAYYIENGTVDGADVGGHTLVALAHIPGNILQGNWKVRLYIDDQASPAQRDALVDAFSGKLGGPLADIAQMVGQVTGVEQVPIRFRMTETDAALEVGAAIEASMEALKGATGGFTSLRDAVFSTIPGSPAYVGRATRYRVDAPEFQLDIQGHSAVYGSFRFEA
jgi:hypothetical protein